jgi:hypothetical protein
MRGEMLRCETRRWFDARLARDDAVSLMPRSRPSPAAPGGVEHSHHRQGRALAGGPGRACRQRRAHDRPRRPCYACCAAIERRRRQAARRCAWSVLCDRASVYMHRHGASAGVCSLA